MKGERKRVLYRAHDALTCVREQGMVIGVIVKFRPHAEGEFLHVRQLRFVMDVLRKKRKEGLWISHVKSIT